MALSIRPGFGFLALGIILGLATFLFAGSTAAACPGLDGILWNHFRIKPAMVKITGIDLSSLTLYWNNGCNGKTSSLIPLLLGIGCIGLGIQTIREGSNWTSANS